MEFWRWVNSRSLRMVLIVLGFAMVGCDKDNPVEPMTVTQPNTPIGLSSGQVGQTLVFSTGGAVCSNGDEVQYRFDWGDSSLSEWGEASQNHAFDAAGHYAIKAQARSAAHTDSESDWSAEGQIDIEIVTGSLLGNDGKTYQTVKIGNQWWLAENLRETKYRSGEAIPKVSDAAEWMGRTEGAYTVYNNDDGGVSEYGYLYNWHTVNNYRNIAPQGWHVPTDEEWKELELYLGMGQSEIDKTDWRGSEEGGKLKGKGTTYWQSPNTGATNATGFNALPAGMRDGADGQFLWQGYSVYYWTKSRQSAGHPWARNLYYEHGGVYRLDHRNEQHGFSIRLVRD